MGSAAGDSDHYLMADFDQPFTPSSSSFGSATPLPLEYSSAPGDSGGGVFIDDGGVQKVAGVVSFGQRGPIGATSGSANSGYGDLMGFTRVSLFNDWIDDQLSARYWNNSSGGAFVNAAHWDEGASPGAGNVAVFNVAGAYTVTLPPDTDNKRVRVRSGDVTIDLANHSYTVHNSQFERSIAVGHLYPDNAKLTFTNGTIVTGDIGVAESRGTSGELTVRGVGTSLTTNGSVGVNGSLTAQGGTGPSVFRIAEGATANVSGTVKVWPNGIVEGRRGHIDREPPRPRS